MNIVIDAMYEGYVSQLVVAKYLVIPHIRYVCVLLPLVMPHVSYAHLGQHIAVSLKGRTAQIWSFDCGFTYDFIIRCAGFKL